MNIDRKDAGTSFDLLNRFRNIEIQTPAALKRALSIIFLIAFLFNVGGYYLVLVGLHLQRDRQLTKRLNADLYEAAETVELKIPMVLPYPIYSGEFERVDGRFEYNGEHYRLIKQKLQNDTLHVICLRDHGTRELITMMMRYVQDTIGSDDPNTDQRTLNCISKLIKDFFLQKDMQVVQPSGHLHQLSFPERKQTFIDPVIPVHAPPPRSLG